MPLVDCVDCGNQVSDKAHQCPTCGRPYKGRGLQRRFSHAEIMIIILAAMALINLAPFVAFLFG